jgi:xanthine dehydrogenase accessory factor
MLVWTRLSEMVARHGAAALVQVHRVRGSAPREVGACMVVRPDGAFHGTIGGGQLEWRALAAARRAIAQGRGPAHFVDQALGPDLGQCCGGHVTLLIETFDRRDAAELATLVAAERGQPFSLECTLDDDGRVQRLILSPLKGEVERTEAAPGGEGTVARLERAAASWTQHYGESRTPVLLFGAGHVGRSVALALAPLPFTVRWIDSREDAFPAHIPANAQPVRPDDLLAELACAPTGSFVIIMTHEHPLDFAITAAALRRDDLGFVGLIGSASKRARFTRRLRELGIAEARIAALVCPVGLPGIRGKEPAVIAAAIAAQLLQEREEAARLQPAHAGELEAAG